MTETPFFFSNGGEALFGVLHEPGRPSAAAGFVFCHPFGEEKLWSHRVFVSFARQLAAEGYPVLRFDYRGSGDSDGAFSAASVTTILSDIRGAIAELRRRCGSRPLGLIGLRLGASFASLIADEGGVDRLVLWAPIVDGARYMQEMLRINLTAQVAAFKEVRQDRVELAAAMERGAVVNIDGYDMSFGMYSEVSAIRLAEGRRRYTGPCLVLNIDRQERPSAELQALARSYPAATQAFAQEEPFWKEIARYYEQAPNVFTPTLEWLRAS